MLIFYTHSTAFCGTSGYMNRTLKKGLKGPVAKLSLTVRLQKQQDKCKQQIVFHIDAQEFGDITYAVVDY